MVKSTEAWAITTRGSDTSPVAGRGDGHVHRRCANATAAAACGMDGWGVLAQTLENLKVQRFVHTIAVTADHNESHDERTR